MERTALLVDLEAAQRRAEQNEIYITRQKQGIAALAAAGANTREAEKILQTLEETHSCNLADMQRILNKLDDQRRRQVCSVAKL